ncbi:hypothetical protein [Bifidobacterium moukalabense]|uniref:ABC transporter permease n=1 Tax=Bifidobacterium moukalabense DSM 27321 TaxID=1435051 RepID=W4NBE6_9BIFI|nr:hypothetical protein [Bifidobacterium moukalabense]ETY72387.1 ABC transporter permease [Bifidobacterium moukalabense DSM 27321]
MGRIHELVRRVGEANRKPVGNSSFNGHGLSAMLTVIYGSGMVFQSIREKDLVMLAASLLVAFAILLALEYGLYRVTDPALTRAGRGRVSCVLLALALIMLVVLICLVLH